MKSLENPHPPHALATSPHGTTIGRGEIPKRLKLAGFLWLLLAGLLSATPAQAQEFNYDADRPAALRACDIERERTGAALARSCYRKLLASGGDSLQSAEAAWGAGDIKRANVLFREAVQANAKATRARVRWARLFLATHQYADAQKLLREALMINPQDVPAQLGMARLLAESFDGAALDITKRLLERDDTLLEAHLIASRMALEENRIDVAERAAKRALELAEQQQRAPLEAYALLAAVQLARGTEPTRWVKRAQDFNAADGGIFELLAHIEVMRRHYEQAITLLRRAVAVEPERWSAHAELGTNLMRFGEMQEARAALKRAYAGDPYEVTTVNTLRLLDSLENFELDRSAPDLTLQLHKKEAGVLKDYVRDLTRKSIATFSKRYGFTPRERLLVELYPDHDDFAVRTAGLPGIGLLGVTFGYVVAMDSPSGRRTGEFHWGSTLWHEVAHVFTLAITDHNVPRWLSEGVSMFEEWRTGPTPGVAVTADVIDALRDGKFLNIEQLDRGFIRPRYPGQVQVSYAQAGLVCLFIEQEWGFDKVVELVRRFNKPAVVTSDAIQATFKIAPAEFDTRFNAYVRQRFAGILAQGEEWEKALRAANLAAQKEQWSAVIEPARRAAEIFPEYNSPNNPRRLLALALYETGKRDEAIAAMQAYREHGGWDPTALGDLAQWLTEAGQASAATEVRMAMNYANPFDRDNHTILGEQLLAEQRAAEALREYRVLLALDTPDQAAAKLGLARAYRGLGETANSRRYLLEVLEQAPHYRPAQKFLLETKEGPTP